MKHLSSEQIAELQRRLENKLVGLRGYKTSVIEENPVNNPDRVEENEAGDEAAEEYGILASQTLEQTSDNMIHEVEAALNRIKAGTYGMDEETGLPISYERLLVMPEARTTKPKN